MTVNRMKKVVLLGSTGSIGTSTCKVATDLSDRIQLIGLAAGNNVELLLAQTRQFRPHAISVTDPTRAADLAPPDGNHPALGRVRVAGVGLAQQVLVLEEQHGVLAPEGRPEHAHRVAGP